MRILKKKNNPGFTLVEILLALAILGIGLVGILSVFVVGSNSIRRTIEMTEASFLAQMVLEDFKRQGHKDPNTINLSDLSDYDEYKEYEPTFTKTSEGQTYRVDVNIKKNGKEIVSFTTYLSKYVP